MATQTTQTDQKKASSPTVNGEEKIVLGSYKDLHADYEWNSRYGAFWEDIETDAPPPAEGEKQKKPPKPTDRSDWLKFKASIKETGTNQEAILCRQPAKPGGKPRVVTGFRRYRAVQELAKAAGEQGPSLAEKGLIRYVVREMTDKEARLANGVENIDRENLSGPDLCAYVGGIIKEFDMSDSEVASRIGKSQPYVSRLHRFYDRLTPAVLEKWRASPVKLTLDDMEKKVLLLKPGAKSDSAPTDAEQEEYFDRVVAEKAGGPERGTRGKLAWIEGKSKEAQELGELLGMLDALGYIKIEEKDPAVILWACVELPSAYKGMEPKEKIKVEKKVLKAFNEGVENGVNLAEEEEGEDDESDEEDEDDVD